MSSEDKVVYGKKKSNTKLQYPYYRKGNYTIKQTEIFQNNFKIKIKFMLKKKAKKTVPQNSIKF